MPDVICYLPEDLMLDRQGENWADLEPEWRGRLDEDVKGTPKNSKKWLKTKKLLPQR